MKKLPNIKSMQGAAGMAILSAIMVVAVISAIAIKYSWKSDLDLKRNSYRWMSMQAKATAEGFEEFAIIVLNYDKQDNKIDSPNDIWWGENGPLDAEQSLVVLNTRDAQARINLNALGENFNDEKGKVKTVGGKYTETQRRFIRMLRAVPLGEDPDNPQFLDIREAEAILEGVKDWIDTDNNPSGYGDTEGDYYERLDPPIVIANDYMISVSELMRIPGMTQDLYQKIKHYVFVPPGGSESAKVPMNVNTLDPWLVRVINQPTVLEPLTPEEGQQLYDEILQSEPETVGDFEGLPILATLLGTKNGGGVNLDSSGLSTTTEWFDLEITVTTGEHVYRSKSLLHRAEDSTRVVRRTDAGF